MDLTNPETLQRHKKEPITIKEGIEYSVEIAFKVEGGVVSGVKYLQIVKRAGLKVDKVGVAQCFQAPEALLTMVWTATAARVYDWIVRAIERPPR